MMELSVLEATTMDRLLLMNLSNVSLKTHGMWKNVCGMHSSPKPRNQEPRFHQTLKLNLGFGEECILHAKNAFSPPKPRIQEPRFHQTLKLNLGFGIMFPCIPCMCAPRTKNQD